jgi:hypothetical protein
MGYDQPRAIAQKIKTEQNEYALAEFHGSNSVC